MVDCFGSLGTEARTFVAACLKTLLGRKEEWAQRKKEVTLWQQLSMAAAKEIGR